MSKQKLIGKRNSILKEIDQCNSSWESNKIRKLQIEASRLANEIGRQTTTPGVI